MKRYKVIRYRVTRDVIFTEAKDANDAEQAAKDEYYDDLYSSETIGEWFEDTKEVPEGWDD